MKIINTVAKLQAALATPRQNGKSIALVPTMGALHEGHLSLIHRARTENDIVVVSVFVNPIQFNNPEDLAKYPRTVDADCQKLASAQADIAFVPSVEEMYPQPVNDVYHFGPIEEVMEGPRRPGHFSGVAVVLRRLFDLVQPVRAYFGEKDFQQIAVVRNLIEQIHYPIEIVACPIVRADDGLALSSRNMRLSPAARAIAPRIYATLQSAVKRSKTASVAEVKEWVLDTLRNINSDDATLINPDTHTVFDPEYFEIVNDTTLQPVNEWSDADGIVGCITVWLTGVRLIDMIRFR